MSTLEDSASRTSVADPLGSLIARIDYLQRNDGRPSRHPGAAASAITPQQRRLLRIGGIGRETKQPEDDMLDTRDDPRLGAEDMLTGLHGYAVPVLFVVGSDGGSVDLRFGTWTPAPRQSEPVLEQQLGILDSVLQGLHPVVFSESDDVLSDLRLVGGVALGMPTIKPATRADPALQLDRLIRAMKGSVWRSVVIAQPVAAAALSVYQQGLLNEMRMAQAGAKAEVAPNTLTEHYMQLLKHALEHVRDASSTGGWRVAVYLLGTRESYPRLAASWRALFSGKRSLPEPVQVFYDSTTADLASSWMLPDDAGRASAGRFRRPFEWQTLLSSRQLAAYVHLPQLETGGFAIESLPRFDVVTRSEGEIRIGGICENARETTSEYRASLGSLTRHVLVSGVTGAGKTNTVFELIRGAMQAGIPFLVIEPAKTEYRSLLADSELGSRLQVLTPNRERIAPMRLNPLEPPRIGGEYAVANHLDLLKALFVASFGMWNPLPAVLEQCLHRSYTARGWDLLTETNQRLGEAEVTDAFPTLGDVAGTVDEVIRGLGYHHEVSDNMRAALGVRLDSLRAGGKGPMLDTHVSMPPEKLFDRPTIIELEGIGDDDEKAFVIGLLLMRLAAYRRSCGESDTLRHLLVIEEAHRLLRNVPVRAAEGEGNAAGKAVEAFTNLLAEVRAYGQGVLIADQTPTALAPAVLKNTGLKLTHRLVSEDDRHAIAASTAMSPAQALRIATLATGEVAAFGEGDDAPLIVKIAPSPTRRAAAMVNDATVRDRAAQLGLTPGADELTASTTRLMAGRIASEPRFERLFNRLVHSVIGDPTALERLWPEIVTYIRPFVRDSTVEPDALVFYVISDAAHRFAHRRGSQGGWAYSHTLEFERTLAAALIAHHRGDRTPLGDFGTVALERFSRDHDPYPGCTAICPEQLCLYRDAASDLLSTGALAARWAEAERADNGDARQGELWNVAADAAYDLVEWPDDSMVSDERVHVARNARRASLCYAQLARHEDAAKFPALAGELTASLIEAHPDPYQRTA